MPSAQKMISMQDVVKRPQYVVEGNAPANYGSTPTNPSFILIGKKTTITKNNEPTFEDDDYSGYRNRQGKTKTRESNSLTISGRLLKGEVDTIIKWGMNTGSGSKTADESRTIMDSYKTNSGTEVYRVWKGCKPISCTLTCERDSSTMFEITCHAKSYSESGTSAVSIGSGSYDSGDNNNKTTLKFKDLGKLMYGTTELQFQSLSLTVTHGQRIQDSNGSETDLYRENSNQVGSGTVAIFKTGPDLNEDARAGLHRSGYLVVDKKTGTADTAASARFPASGSNYITISSRIPGVFGNDLDVQILAGSGTTVTAYVEGDILYISPKSSGTTANEVKAAIEANHDANDLFRAAVTGSGTTSITLTAGKTDLASGANNTDHITLRRINFLVSDDPMTTNEATIESKTWEVDAISVRNSS